MPRRLRVTLTVVVVLVALGFAAGRYLLGREAVPATSTFTLDLAELRRLASAVPGSHPVRINHEQVSEAALPRGAVFAGESLRQPHRMSHGAYQIVHPDGFGMIDSAFDAQSAAAMARGEPVVFSNDAYAAIQRGLAGARWIVVTHEHADHVGGVVKFPRPPELAGRLVLSREQLGNTADISGLRELAPALRAALEPLSYDRVHALAPGVVLVKAPGHTPGSQMVFVQLADGREVLFLGDVAWHLDQIRRLWYRPRIVTDYYLGEDRAQVLGEFRALHDLAGREPALVLLVSHDADQRAELIRTGVLGSHFESP